MLVVRLDNKYHPKQKRKEKVLNLQDLDFFLHNIFSSFSGIENERASAPN